MDSSPQTFRVRTPKGKELLGTITEILGGSRLRLQCTDGKKRLCRIPGKFRKRIRIKPGDILLITPWEIEPDTKGDVEYIYTRTQAYWLKKKGFI